MIQKIEKLIDVWTQVGESLLAKELAGAPVKREEPAPAKPARVKKEKVAAPSPFEPVAQAEPDAPTTSVDENIQRAAAKAKCQEVMGLFIRRYLKSAPPGLERAKAILTDVCGRPIGKLEDLTHADNLLLIPRFEKELAEAK